MTATAAHGGSIYEFDVFVSYAHADSHFVAALVNQLKSSGIRVWLDEERMRGGLTVQASLNEALAKAATLVCVATSAWEQSDYTQYEAKVFREQDRERQKRKRKKVWRPQILVHRDHEHKIATNPVHLHDAIYVEWPSTDDPDEKFWVVFCAIRQKDPGPRDLWSDRGREAQGLPSTSRPILFADATGRAGAPQSEVSQQILLGCGREKQWKNLLQLAATPRNEVIFLIGPVREAHSAFLRRLHHCLPDQRPRRIVAVKWKPPQTPIGKSGYFDALARAFDCDRGNLADRTWSQLAHQDLILVHEPVAQEAFERKDLVNYYKFWLPEFIGEMIPEDRAHPYCIKAVQAIAWKPKGSFAARLLANFWGSAIADELTSSEEAARRLISQVRKLPHPRLPIEVLPELDRLTDEVVRQWSLRLPYPTKDRERLLQVILGSGPDSESRLAKILELFAPIT